MIRFIVTCLTLFVFTLGLGLSSPSLAEPRLVYIDEVPDAFNPIPLTKVSWAKRSSEGKKAREACGGDFEFVGHSWEANPRRLIHIAQCK